MKPKLFLISFLLLCPGLAVSEEPEQAGAEIVDDGTMTPEEVKSTREFTQKRGRIETLRNQIDTAKEKFAGLVKTKNATQNPQAKRELMAEMVQTHGEIEKLTKELNLVRDEVIFKYPGAGKILIKHYGPVQSRTLEELEGESALNQKLTAAKRAMDRKYQSFKVETRAPAAATTPKPDAPAAPAMKPSYAEPDEAIDQRKFKLEK